MSYQRRGVFRTPDATGMSLQNRQPKKAAQKGPAPKQGLRAKRNGDKAPMKQKQFKVGRWTEMVVNPQTGAVAPTPCRGPEQAASMKFTRTFTLPADTSPETFSLIVRPRIAGTLAVTRANGEDLQVGDYLDGGADFHIGKLFGAPGTGRFSLSGSVTLKRGNTTLGEVLTQVVDDLDAIPIQSGAADIVRIGFAGLCRSAHVWVLNAGVWTQGPDVTSTPSNLNGPFDRLSLVVIDPKMTHGFSVDITVNAVFAPGSLQLVAGAFYDLFDTDAITLSEVHRYRVTAMSVLATFTGNAFNSGGQIAAARTEPGYDYEAEGPYVSLTKLTTHVYSGYIKDGAYVWYLPRDQGMDFRGLHDNVPDRELRVAGLFTDVEGALKVTLTMVVEFYSPLQIFPKVMLPPLTDMFTQEYYALNMATAATCNPAHNKVLNSIVRSAGRAASQGARYAIQNPEVMLKLLSTLAI